MEICSSMLTRPSDCDSSGLPAASMWREPISLLIGDMLDAIRDGMHSPAIERDGTLGPGKQQRGGRQHLKYM
jgi:hypothetical protein